MKIEELEKFCMENASWTATGKDKDGKERSGRILAYTPSKSGGWILLEDVKLPKKKLPDPLPKVPFIDGRWHCVVGACHFGIAVLADSVRLMPKAIGSATIAVETQTPEPAPKKAYVGKSKCNHPHYPECPDPTWCSAAYAGFV